MKYLKIILSLLIVMTFGIDAYSHGSTSTRSKKCRSWRKKYKSKAFVTKGWIVNKGQTTKSCSYALAHKNFNPYVGQSSINDHGSSTFRGYTAVWWCGRGTPNSALFYDVFSLAVESEEEYYESSDITTEEIQFGLNEIVIPQINGDITVKGAEMFSSLEIIVWLPEDDYINEIEDTIPTVEKILWQGKVELSNGEVVLTGDFPEDSYSLLVVDGGYQLVFDNLDVVAMFPEGMSTSDKEDVAVLINSDGGSKEESTIEAIEEETINDESITFSVFPNPSSSITNIQFNSEEVGSGFVRLYDFNGNLVSTIFEGEFETENNFTFDFNELNTYPGIHSILIQVGDKQYFKNIIKE